MATIPRVKRKQPPRKWKPWGKNENRDIYDSPRWKELRDEKLAAYPYCEECHKKGKRSYATIVDHIIAIKDGGDPWDWHNLRSLCDSCHNRKSARERWNRK